MANDPVIFDRGSADKIAAATKIVLNDTEAGPFGWKSPPPKPAARLPFTVFRTTGTKIKITGGTVHHPFYLQSNGAFTAQPVADSAEITLTNGDHVWLELQGQYDRNQIQWGFNWTSSGVAAVTPIKFYLWKSVTVDNGNITGRTVLWPGGNIIFGTTFIGCAYLTDGASNSEETGGGGANCAFTYSLYTRKQISWGVADDQLLATGLTPLRPRLPGIKYCLNGGSYESACLAMLDADGAFRIVDVPGEMPVVRSVTLVNFIDFTAPVYHTVTLQVLDET